MEPGFSQKRTWCTRPGKSCNEFIENWNYLVTSKIFFAKLQLLDSNNEHEWVGSIGTEEKGWVVHS